MLNDGGYCYKYCFGVKLIGKVLVGYVEKGFGYILDLKGYGGLVYGGV